MPDLRRGRGAVKLVSREADGAKRSGLTEPWTAGQSRVVMAAVHAPCCTSAMSQDDRGALVKERQEGGDHLPPQFRIQSECALTYMNAVFRKNLTDALAVDANHVAARAAHSAMAGHGAVSAGRQRHASGA